MTREIKFRAWFPEKEYMDDEGKTYTRPAFMEYNPKISKRIVISTEERDIATETLIQRHSLRINNCFDPNVTWEQYTGLKDKDGKEIYEGDIVESIVTDSDGFKEWHYKFFGVVIYEVNGFGIKTDLKDKECEVSLFSNTEQGWETIVLGNIHEKPKLLEKEKDQDE